MATGAVISGATRGPGGTALGRHLADRRSTRQNDGALLGATRGIISEDIEAAIAELTRICSHARSKQPLYHVHLDPQLPWTEQQYARYWQLFEKEFGFQNQPFVEAIHIKHGRAHDHRVYSRVRRNGTIIPLKYDYARREKLSRIVEFEFGGRHIAGGHNWAVAAALKKEGRQDVLASIEKAGLTTAQRPAPAVTPEQRAQAERTGIDPRVLASIALTIWQTEVSGDALIAAFALEGFRLAQGEKVPVIIDAAGGAHSLTRYIGQASAAAGKRIKAAEVRSRLLNIDLPPLRPKGNYYVITSDDTGVDAEADAWDVKGTPQSRPATDPTECGEARGRARPQPDRFSDDSHSIQYRGNEISNQGFGDAASRRANRVTKNHIVAPGRRAAKRKNTQRVGGTRRGAGRARAADYRAAGILGQPEFRAELDRIVDLTVALDPGLALNWCAENARVEAMLAEVEFSQKITAIEALTSILVRLLAWFLECLFGASPAPLQGDVQVVADEAAFFNPST
ncbi:MAG: hypothetical protein POH28_11110 [Acidocella sp.]|nr:hypothetical protein [Acidocella sp.]